MRSLFVLLACLFSIATTPVSAETRPGRVTGGQSYTIPGWFKLSFLNIPGDIKDAARDGKKVMLFFHLDACPYCARMLKDSFQIGSNRKYIQNHFNVIAINIRGDEEVTWTNKNIYTEKALAKELGIYATPTIIVFDTTGRNVLRLNGYRKSKVFRQSLEYVQKKAFKKQSLAKYIENQQLHRIYTTRGHPLFKNISSFRGFKKPLAILFENRDCMGCNNFYEKVLLHPEVMKQMARFTFVRLDTYSNKPIVTISGRQTTPRQWSKTLGISYHPGIILFNEGKEITRIDGRLYHFHFREILRYVSGQHYQRSGNFSAYLQQRQQSLLKQGINIDLSE